MKRIAIVVPLLLVLVSCSSWKPAAKATTAARRSVGTIAGRMYADGGPPVCAKPPSSGCHPAVVYEPVRGYVTIRAVGGAAALKSVRPDMNGHFYVTIASGRYEVVGTPTDGFRSATGLRQVVTVTAGKTVNADLGIHMP